MGVLCFLSMPILVHVLCALAPFVLVFSFNEVFYLLKKEKRVLKVGACGITNNQIKKATIY